MNKVSSLVTGGATLTVTTLEPLVRWGLTGFHTPIPDTVPGVIATLALMGIHAVGNVINARLSKPKQ